MATPTTFTITVADMSAFAGLAVVIATLLGLYIKLFVTAELVRQEGRLMEKIKLQFAQKEITELQWKGIREDVDELKLKNNH